MSKLVQKIPKIIEATSSWSLDLLDLSCVDRTTTLRHYYQQSTITCCYFAVWDDESETIPWKINMVFPSELFFFVILQASVPVIALSLNLSTAATKCYVCRSAHIDDIGWKGFRSNLWLSITETLIGNSFAVCFCTGHTCRHFNVSVVFSANWK